MSLTATDRRLFLEPGTRRAAPTARTELEWLAGGALMAFAVPFAPTDLLDTPRDLYYALSIAAVTGLFGVWLRTNADPRAILVRRWRWESPSEARPERSSR